MIVLQKERVDGDLEVVLLQFDEVGEDYSVELRNPKDENDIYYAADFLERKDAEELFAIIAKSPDTYVDPTSEGT